MAWRQASRCSSHSTVAWLLPEASILLRSAWLAVLDEFAVPAYDIQAVYQPQRYLPAKVRFFIDYLKEICGGPRHWRG